MTAAHSGRRSEITALAADHGLMIDSESIRFNDAGLDYLVAFATAEDTTEWALRLPRRDDVAGKIDDEAKILRFVRDRLSVAVPDWRIQSRDLIAYPTLPGEPGLTLDAAGEPVWHVDREDPRYAVSLGRLIAELHGIDVADARAAGIPSQSTAEVRAEWRARLDQVSAAFTIAASLRDQWIDWMADDELWPEFTVFTHGELYPAHLLLGADGSIRSVLDWTTAKVGDPALEFMYHYMLSTPETFQLALDAYADITGRVPQHLLQRCAALLSAGPLNYAAYALTTRAPEHMAAAAAQLNPETA